MWLFSWWWMMHLDYNKLCSVVWVALAVLAEVLLGIHPGSYLVDIYGDDLLGLPLEIYLIVIYTAYWGYFIIHMHIVNDLFSTGEYLTSNNEALKYQLLLLPVKELVHELDINLDYTTFIHPSIHPPINIPRLGPHDDTVDMIINTKFSMKFGSSWYFCDISCSFEWWFSVEISKLQIVIPVPATLEKSFEARLAWFISFRKKKTFPCWWIPLYFCYFWGQYV